MRNLSFSSKGGGGVESVIVKQDLHAKYFSSSASGSACPVVVKCGYTIWGIEGGGHLTEGWDHTEVAFCQPVGMGAVTCSFIKLPFYYSVLSKSEKWAFNGEFFGIRRHLFINLSLL